MTQYKKGMVWIRRDLRLNDHSGLRWAGQNTQAFFVVFVFDSKILAKLKNPQDRRLTFIFESLVELNYQLEKKGSRLVVIHGDPQIEIPKLASTFGVDAVVAGVDFEKYAKKRDSNVKKTLADKDIHFQTVKDHILLGSDVLKKDQTPYRVFTPYMKSWYQYLQNSHLKEQKPNLTKLLPASELMSAPVLGLLDQYGFKKAKVLIPAGASEARKLLKKFSSKISNYKNDRDFPAIRGTSKLSVHLRFGTLSIREAFRFCLNGQSAGPKTWASELIWREFYSMILDQFPHVERGAFKKEYDKIEWPGKPAHFKAWCEGQTGYPIVDAAMNQLNETGFMHNRLRMIVASFLVKDLLIDWKKGEAYFAEHLLDYDLASNNGGWQWAASTGCDAQPYFRIFNPDSQTDKFDPESEFLRQWVPAALDEKSDYPDPIVNHKVQRLKALDLYKAITH